MNPIDLGTPEALASAAGAVLALFFILIPPARRWFVERDGDTQKAITGGAILLVAALAVIGTCANVIATGIVCTQQGIVDYFLRVAFASVLGVGINRGLFAGARVAGRRRPRLKVIGANDGGGSSSSQSKLLD